MNKSIYSIGHSTHSYEAFLRLLRSAGVSAIADVRSSPYSRSYPQFNREFLKPDLNFDKVSYAFLGDQLGGRPKSKELFTDGVADYEKMAAQASFKRGIARVIDGASKYRIALMCSEHDPKDCHRCLLVGRALAREGLTVRHILWDGRILDQAEIENELLHMLDRTTTDLFSIGANKLAIAYRSQAKRVAFVEPKSTIGRPSTPPAVTGRSHR